MAPTRDTSTAGRTRGLDYVRRAPETDWRQARLITAGVDVGSTTSQAVVLGDGRILGYSSAWTGADSPDSASEALEPILRLIGMKAADIRLAVGTGCGEAFPAIVSRTVSEIACHARGAHHAVEPPVKTVLAMGGRDCTVIRCKDTGAVASFLANACRPAVCRENLCNACGAAQGQAIDAVAEALDLRIEDVGEMSLGLDEQDIARRLTLPRDDRECIEDEMLREIGDEILAGGGMLPFSGAVGVVCAVLAGKQAAGLRRNGWSPPEILAAYCAALAHQAAQLAKRLGVEPEIAITGGVARNAGVVSRLERELGIRTVPVGPDPQIAAALGAALYAADFALGTKPGDRQER
jgi:activator of 2-hydroxyglutaryl-CoA dehydratase